MSYFLDFSGLSKEDIDKLNYFQKVLGLPFNEAVGKFMQKYPGKIRVLAEMKDGEVIRDEIDKNGVTEYKGREAIARMIADMMKRKKDREDGS